MTWARIDDGAPSHPKFVSAGPDAAWLWTAGLCYANKHTTDGRLPKVALAAFYASPEWSEKRQQRAATRLVSVGLWLDEGSEWLIHDYAEYQEEALKEQVLVRRAAARERKRRQRDRDRSRNSGVFPVDTEPSHAVTGRDSHAGVTVTVTGQVPHAVTRLLPREHAEPRVHVSQPPDPSRPDPSYDREIARDSDPHGTLPQRVSHAIADAFLRRGTIWKASTQGRHVAALAEWLDAASRHRRRDPIEILHSLLEEFFGNDRARAARYPVAWLAREPSQYDRALIASTESAVDTADTIAARNAAIAAELG